MPVGVAISEVILCHLHDIRWRDTLWSCQKVHTGNVYTASVETEMLGNASVGTPPLEMAFTLATRLATKWSRLVKNGLLETTSVQNAGE
jgi:hypothetical protein